MNTGENLLVYGTVTVAFFVGLITVALAIVSAIS